MDLEQYYIITFTNSTSSPPAQAFQIKEVTCPWKSTPIGMEMSPDFKFIPHPFLKLLPKSYINQGMSRKKEYCFLSCKTSHSH